MLRKLTFYVVTLLLLWPAAQRWTAAQAPAPQAKDQQEADLFNSILKETNPNTQLQLLNEWKQKYPDTALIQQRLGFYMQVFQALNQGANAVNAANELLKLAPDNFGAYLTLALFTPFLGSTAPDVLANGEKAGNFLLQHAGEQFAPEKKPANVTNANWAQLKETALIAAHQTLGWVAKAQKKFEVAEQELIKTLDLSPNSAFVSYWLGEAVRDQKNPDKTTLALYSFARAAAYNGPGALQPQGRQQVNTYLTKIYTLFHGDDSGLAELKAMATKEPLPPPDFKIKSSAEVQADKEEELRKTNPLLAVFMRIKEGLTGPEGTSFWNEMKGKAMPELRGTVVSAKPAVKPKVVELAMSQSQTAEVTLTNPETSARCKLDPGAVINFKDAEAKDFTPTPFMLKLDGGKITSGCAEAPPPAKKTPGKASPKAGAKKKAG